MGSRSKIPDGLLQEVKALLAVRCREMCFTDRGNGENSAGQEALLEKVFHGSEGYESLLKSFIEGSGVYVSCFNKVPIENNREGNEGRPEAFMLELKQIFHCEEGKKSHKFTSEVF